MAQTNFCDIFRLLLVNAKAIHEIRHDIRVFLCIADDGNCLVDIQQNGLETVQQVQLFLFFCQIIANGALFALRAPGCPFVQNAAHAEHLRHALNEHVKIAGTAVHQRRHLHQAIHELIRIRAALDVNRQLETGQIAFISNIRDFTDLAALDEIRKLVNDCLDGRCIRNLIHFNEIFRLDILPL